jgi:hypothetical protein
MKSLRCVLKITPLLLLAFGAGAGCETTDGGGQPSNVYYGTGFADPWYYGGYYDDVDTIVVPPRDHDVGAHPEHPIAEPSRPEASRPEARPMAQPSIPSMPRASFRGGR